MYCIKEDGVISTLIIHLFSIKLPVTVILHWKHALSSEKDVI